MPDFNTPGFYIQENTQLSDSVPPIETAIPAFIGYTEFAKDERSNELTNKPKRITSLIEFERFFGEPFLENFLVKVDQSGRNISVQIYLLVYAYIFL